MSLCNPWSCCPWAYHSVMGLGHRDSCVDLSACAVTLSVQFIGQLSPGWLCVCSFQPFKTCSPVAGSMGRFHSCAGSQDSTHVDILSMSFCLEFL